MKELAIRIRVDDDEINTAMIKKGFTKDVLGELEVLGMLEHLKTTITENIKTIQNRKVDIK